MQGLLVFCRGKEFRVAVHGTKMAPRTRCSDAAYVYRSSTGPFGRTPTEAEIESLRRRGAATTDHRGSEEWPEKIHSGQALEHQENGPAAPRVASREVFSKWPTSVGFSRSGEFSRTGISLPYSRHQTAARRQSETFALQAIQCADGSWFNPQEFLLRCD